jgi:elongation factor 1-alpha
MSNEKPHLSIVISGHVDSGKSTTTGRLLIELGGIGEREMEKLKAEAETLGKGSFAFAFYMDTQAEERKRGVTIACNTKEFFTEKYHYTIIDAPGHRDFINNMISGASQADVALLLVPASGGFTAAICKEDRKAGIIQGQTRQHGLLLNLLGVSQLIVGLNKMDEKTVKYSQARYKEVAGEMKDMLVKVGWKKKFIKECTPFLPMSGWMGDNLTKPTTNMAWWKGQDVVAIDGSKHHVGTLLDCLNNFIQQPDRKPTLPARVPLSGVFNIKGVGAVLTGCVEQGTIKPDAEVVFMPTHTQANPCEGTVFTSEMHHKKGPFAGAGDAVGRTV